MTTTTFDANAQNLATISTQFPNVKIKQFPPDVINALKASNQKLLDEEKQRSAMAKKIIE